MVRFSGGGGGINVNCSFWFPTQLLSGTFMILRRILRDVAMDVYWSSCKAPLNYLERYSKKNPQISWTSVQWERTDCNRTLWSLWGGWKLYVGVSVLPRQESHVEGSFRHWGQKVAILFLKPPGVRVETRWCIGAVHQLFLVINYSIIEVTLFCSDCSIYRYKSLYTHHLTPTTLYSLRKDLLSAEQTSQLILIPPTYQY
jgi:hypothetical protein